jgi:hypothetical protein
LSKYNVVAAARIRGAIDIPGIIVIFAALAEVSSIEKPQIKIKERQI